MMLKRYFAYVLFSALLAATAHAQDECTEVAEQIQSVWQKLQSVRSANSEAATEYSTCVEDQGQEYCKNEYSRLQSVQKDLEPAISEYKSDRDSALESGCIEQSDRPFGKVQPLGVWPPK